MRTKICVVYHSGYGHTQRVAEAVVTGGLSVENSDCRLVSVTGLDEDSRLWDELDNADAMIFGAPTYMGSISAEMKRFMEATSSRWMEMKWADKLAAGFTNSGSQNGDKQNTLITLATFAAQHGMIWINLNQLPGNNSSSGSVEDVNRLGSSLGAMAQSNIDEGPDLAPLQSDLQTAVLLGERVASCVKRWKF
ncbi:MAG: flavodoxin family protein [Gammaproteobacteria bacterium]